MNKIKVNDPRFGGKDIEICGVYYVDRNRKGLVSSTIANPEDEEGFSEPWEKYTINAPDEVMQLDEVVVNTHFEHVGSQQHLARWGIIEDTPLRIISYGRASYPVHRLTALGLSLFEGLPLHE